MISAGKHIHFVCVLLALAVSVQAQSPHEQVQTLTAQLQQTPTDHALREKIIKLVQGMKPPPAVPEEAERRMVRGGTAFANAKEPADFAKAAGEFQAAANVAPWLAGAYFNLGVAQEKAGQPAPALEAFRWYVLAAPAAPDMAAVKKRIFQLEYAVEQIVKEASEREITGKDGAPMLKVAAGEFLYGDNNQRLSLPAFYMDKYEVSVAQYAKYMAAAGAKAPEYWPTSALVSHGQKPVVGVSWYEAEAYCHYYGKRLPTEQEWEKAARGTDGRTYPWGNESPTSRHANFGKANFGKTCKSGMFSSCDPYKDVLQPVGTYEEGKSPYGLYDLAGNVLEWTSSAYNNSSGYMVIRGGSWLHSAADLRSAFRRSNNPSNRLYYGPGFRCAKTP